MVTNAYSWSYLPMVVVCQILTYLNLNERLLAASTCRHWRSCLWQPLLWRVVKFRLADNKEKLNGCQRLAWKCGKFIYEATLEFNSRSFEVVNEICQILQLLGPNVQKIVFRPSSCQIEWPSDGNNVEGGIKLFVNALQAALCKSRYFRHLSLGYISEITDHTNELLQSICRKQLASRVEVLHVASVKEDPSSYSVFSIYPDVLTNFSNLRMLSIDYDHLSVGMIHGFVKHGRTSLRQLVIHIHDHEPNHEHIPDSSWCLLTSAGNVEVTLNLIHSKYGIENLLELISPTMPLVHFRAFFCSCLNIPAISFLGQQVGRKLKSFLLVDGMNGIEKPNIYESDLNEDPFVMLAWKCPSLASFTLIGFEISDENVIAIARLRGQELKKLDIPQCCITTAYEDRPTSYFIDEVSNSLGCQWEPLANNRLHPAVIREEADAETFYLDILRSDQD